MANHPHQLYQVGDRLALVTGEIVYVESCRREYFGKFEDEPENVYSAWMKYPFGRAFNIPENWLAVLVKSNAG